MRKKVFFKKLKSSLVLLVVAVVIVSTLFSSAINIHSAHAASGSKGSLYTAKAKLIFLALDHCFQQNGDGVGKAVKKDGNGAKIELGGLGDGYYLETTLDGSGTDNNSVWSCTELGKHLEILEWIGIDYKTEFLCDGDNYGLLQSKSGYMCQDLLAKVLSGDETAYTDWGALDYLDKVFAEKVFGGDIPGCGTNISGRIGPCLAQFTDLEKYYIYVDAFKEKCAVSTGYSTDPGSGGVGIPEINANGEIEMHYYSMQSRSVKIYADHRRANGSYNGDEFKYTCSQIANNLLDTNGAPVKNGLISELGADCQEKYEKNIKEVSDWWAAHESEYTEDNYPNAKADVEAFLASHSTGSQAWSYDHTKPEFTCNVSDIAQEWSTIVEKNNFTNAPNLGGSWYSGNLNPGGGGNAGGVSDCHGASGALGWFVCPVLEWASKAADWAFTKVIMPRLSIDTDLVSTTAKHATSRQDSGTYQAWKIFRDLANIVFGIFLLLIIFSQVTGVGIDNYGIKKSLPKLIIAVLLVNLSFYICQFAVDISNVLGASVYTEIIKISDGITIDTTASYGNIMGPGGSITVGILEIIAVVGIGTAVAGAAFWAAVGSALLAIVPTVLSAVVAILFLFILLTMRQAVVVILVAISPLAFVCYALPNTKQLFTRWWNVLRGMLLMYPIAAMLIAGGRLVSRILFAAGGAQDNMEMILVAMAAEIAPLFFIPSVVRSAYNATGALGAALGNLRGRLVNGTRNGVRNSQRFRNATERRDARRAQRALNSRSTRRYDAAAKRLEKARKAGDRGSLYDRYVTRAGNRDRIAAMKQAASQAGAKEGEKAAWAKADSKKIYEGARGQAETTTTNRLNDTAEFANGTFNQATILQADFQREKSRDDKLLWMTPGYKEGKENASKVARDNELKETQRWTDKDYLRGKIAEAGLQQSGDEARTKLYSESAYVTARQQQQDTAISGEVSRMYSERYSRMSAKDVQNELADSMDKRKPDEHRAERFEAASKALIGMGLADKVREKMDEQSDSLHDLTKGKDPKNTRFRNTVASVAGGSGDFMLREYSKHLGMFGGEDGGGDPGKERQLSFKDWKDGGKAMKVIKDKTTGETEKTADNEDLLVKGMSFASSIQQKGMGSLDKDSLQEAAKSGAIAAGASAREIARYASTVSDPATVQSLINAIRSLDTTKKGKVKEATNGSQFVNMNNNVRLEIASAADWKAQLGKAIANDPQIRSKLSAAEDKDYVDDSTSTP